MGFTKLDEGILTSSVMGEKSDIFKVWVAFLASCKYDGIARVTPIFLSGVCHIEIDIVRAAIKRLEAPDPDSRSKEEDGRRIVPAEGGWFVVNYKKYREFTYSDSPEAVRQRRHRDMMRERDGALRVTKSCDTSASAICLLSSEDLRGGVGEGDLSAWRKAVELEIRKEKAGEGMDGFEMEVAVKERMEAWDKEHLKPGRTRK